MMDDVGTVLLDEVQRRFREVCDEDIAMGVLNRILETDRANAEYAGLYADRVGELLAQVYAEMVSSERLPDGRMYWNIAQKVVQEPLVNNYRLAAVAAEKAQKAQNRRAGIGLNAVRPELNEERVKGIMNKVSEAADYDEAASMLDRPVVNMTRAVVDDSVKANAAFQSESGLGVKVVRRTTGAHPCDWCKSLAGTYDYEKVKGGHDVWRRHLDCHCVIEVVSSKGTERVNNYRPSGRRDEAALEARRSAPAVEMPTRAEIEARKNIEGLSLRYVVDAKTGLPHRSVEIGKNITDATGEYLLNATPGAGQIVEQEENEIYAAFKTSDKDELAAAEWLKKNFGGDILLRGECKERGKKSADFQWKGKLWDLKSPTGSSKGTIAAQVRAVKHQIEANAGGLILDISKCPLDVETIKKDLERELNRRIDFPMDVIIKRGDEIVCVLKYQV